MLILPTKKCSSPGRPSTTYELLTKQPTPDGKKIATKILSIFSTCPIPEIARLGRTPRRWKDAFLAYFTTNRANDGPTEALNGIIELHRRLARGFRNRKNYRL